MNLRPADELILEEEDQRQNGDGAAGDNDRDRVPPPHLLPQRRLLGGERPGRGGLLRRLRRCLGGGRRGVPLVPDVAFRQPVIEVKGEERLLPRPRCPLHQQLQLPRLGGIEVKVLRDGEDADLAQGWRALRRHGAEPFVIAIPEPPGRSRLQQTDTVENAAPHIAGALEGVLAGRRDEDGLLSRLEAPLQLLVDVLTQQAFADRVNADECHV